MKEVTSFKFHTYFILFCFIRIKSFSSISVTGTYNLPFDKFFCMIGIYGKSGIKSIIDTIGRRNIIIMSVIFIMRTIFVVTIFFYSFTIQAYENIQLFILSTDNIHHRPTTGTSSGGITWIRLIKGRMWPITRIADINISVPPSLCIRIACPTSIMPLPVYTQSIIMF